VYLYVDGSIYLKAEAEISTPNHVTFVCPYERYKKVKPFIQSQEAALTSAENTATVHGTEDDAERIRRVSRRKLHLASLTLIHEISLLNALKSVMTDMLTGSYSVKFLRTCDCGL
jgi:hypothetical protein